MKKNKLILHAFNKIKGLGPKKFQFIKHYFQSDLEYAWHHPEKWPFSKTSNNFIEQKSHINLCQEEEMLKNLEINLYDPHTENAFPLLKQMSDCPIVLYYRGRLPDNNSVFLTAVGTRMVSDYGRSVTENLITTAAHAGISIISGLAYGVDVLAHQIAIKHKTYTAAVLGSGVNIVTPWGNYPTARAILQNNGMLISEAIPNSNIDKGSFQKRNRILAGISPVTLIIEAAKKSGALITAKYALDYNREVASVPGSIFSSVSVGCNNLISDGACMINCENDLLNLYNLELKKSSLNKKLSENEQLIIKLITNNICQLDHMIKQSSIDGPKLMAILTNMELEGLIYYKPGIGYHLTIS